MAVQKFVDRMPELGKGGGDIHIEVVIQGDVTDGNVGRITDELKTLAQEINKTNLRSWRTRGVKPPIKNF
jgi:hypothetical protein